ncbi:MAG: hypothetical protein A2Y33_06850 [Spirochaetes bacterium GWF1_51_8]|nr:MAG: hypothetical protein A2Y33_06850 [Spirochaetes bacterium GWF1_51_8]
MKAKIIKGLIYLAIGFAALFVIRLIYGFATGEKTGVQSSQYYLPAGYANNEMTIQSGSSGSSFYMEKNFAGEKMMKNQTDNAGNTVQVEIEQKYEMIANMELKSSDFPADEKKMRDLSASNGAIIQYESMQGLPGSRQLQLVIGVPPEKFDYIVKQFQGIGKVKNLSINKYDKTSEYNDLMVQKQSLETMRESLVALKYQKGSIKEMIELQQQILEVEKSIRTLGVSIGEFAEENEFCTVEVTLSEGSGVFRIIFAVVLLSLEWAFWVYFGILGLGAVALFVVFIIVKIMEKTGFLFKLSGAKTEEKK